VLRIVVRPQAESDIEAAATWHELRRQQLGQRFLDELDHVLDRVANHPTQFPEISNGVHRALLRRFPFSVYFVCRETEIVVIAVFHQRRNPSSWEYRTHDHDS
jgi:plasmid stabilization system protein ParE